MKLAFQRAGSRIQRRWQWKKRRAAIFLPFYPPECFPTLNTSRFYHSKQDAGRGANNGFANSVKQGWGSVFFLSGIQSLEQSLNCLVGWIHCLGVSLFNIQLRIGSTAKNVLHGSIRNYGLVWGSFVHSLNAFLCVSPRIKPAASENGFSNLSLAAAYAIFIQDKIRKQLAQRLQTN